MIEAGRIDTAHHETWAARALQETLELDETIQEGALPQKRNVFKVSLESLESLRSQLPKKKTIGQIFRLFLIA